MRVAVTGAAGFLGRAVVAALQQRGYSVRAFARSRMQGFPEGVEVVEADLRTDRQLENHLVDVDAVVHLAASMSGSDASRFSETILATERLLRALPSGEGRRLILCSSFSVYDWEAAKGSIDETLALNPRIYRNGGYAAAKLWQERITRRFAERQGWQLTILRPGFIWGAGKEIPSGSLGPRIGPLQLVFGPRRRLPFTHVVNCADCIAASVTSDAAAGAIFNVVDEFPLSAWKFARIAQRHEPTSGHLFLIPVPYHVARVLVAMVGFFGKLFLGPRARLPSFLVPSRFAQGYKPLEYDTSRATMILEWHPPLGFNEAVKATWHAD